jgi:hypothetical protein
MESGQTINIFNQLLGDEFKSHLSKYQPKKSYTIDYKCLSQLTEYRDYKFSNGFYYLEPEELKSFVKKLTVTNFELLLNQLFGTNPELYELFKKILMGESSESEYRDYIEKLEATGVMNYNWNRYSSS